MERECGQHAGGYLPFRCAPRQNPQRGRSAMETMKRKWIFAGSLVTVLIAVVMLWPQPYEWSRVHPSLQRLQQPYRTVEVSCYLDGGSLGVLLIDRVGERLELAIPNFSGKCERLFTGALHLGTTNAVEVPFNVFHHAI